MPGFGRRYDAEFDDGLPKPPVVVPQVHTQIPVSIPTGAGVANIHNSLKTENKMNAVPPGGTAHVPHSSVPTGVSHPAWPVFARAAYFLAFVTLATEASGMVGCAGQRLAATDDLRLGRQRTSVSDAVGLSSSCLSRGTAAKWLWILRAPDEIET